MGPRKMIALTYVMQVLFGVASIFVVVIGVLAFRNGRYVLVAANILLLLVNVTLFIAEFSLRADLVARDNAPAASQTSGARASSP